MWSVFDNSIFRKYVFEKYFWNIKIFWFFEKSFFGRFFYRKFRWNFVRQKIIFRKIEIFDFSKLCFRKKIENRVMKKMSQKVFGSNFSKNKYFYLNPKAYQQAWPWLSFPLLDIKNGPLRKKISWFFVRGALNSGTQFSCPPLGFWGITFWLTLLNRF